MKNLFKAILALVMFNAVSEKSFGQVKEINPSVQWNFVRTDSVEMIEGNTYIYKFPAKKGFDYIITLQHGEFAKNISIQVFDMQGSLIAEYDKSTAMGSSDLQFDVQHNATYQVKVRIGSSTPAEPVHYETLFSLLKREKV